MEQKKELLKEQQYEVERVPWAVMCLAEQMDIDIHPKIVHFTRGKEPSEIEDEYNRKLEYIGKKKGLVYLGFEKNEHTVKFYFCKRHKCWKDRVGEIMFKKCKEGAKEGAPGCYDEGEDYEAKEIFEEVIREKFERYRVAWR